MSEDMHVSGRCSTVFMFGERDEPCPGYAIARCIDCGEVKCSRCLSDALICESCEAFQPHPETLPGFLELMMGRS